MSSLFTTLRNSVAYLIAWLLLSALLSALVNSAGNAAWVNSIVFALPMTLVYAFAVGFSSYYLCRAYPISHNRNQQLLILMASAAMISGVLWALLCSVFNQALLSLEQNWAGIQLAPNLKMTIAALGGILYALAAAVHYLLAEFIRARLAERQQLEAKLMAQEAQLRMLRTQIDPHFLFNSLNSISALTTINPSGAREMTLLLADFFRRSLNLEEQRKISLAEEIGLIQQFLAIEKIRFGTRLQIEQEIDESALNCLLPPMILQPLVENAIKHGIANLLDGGVLSIRVSRKATQLHICIANDVDADSWTQGRPTKQGKSGIGLENVRQRLLTTYGHTAALHCDRQAARFRVELYLPLQS